MKYAHRVSYEVRYGYIGDGLCLDHLCKVTSCVNPEHLEPVTHAENNRRGSRTKLTADIVREIRSSAERQHVIARRHSISQPQVSRIKNRRSWSDLA
jgi:hypothetical protein